MKKIVVLPFFLFFILPNFAQVANDYFKPLTYRNIGPFRGGRSVGSSGVINDPLTYYMGTSGGGLWKTEDAGQRWTNISDGFFNTSSVGAVAVSESNPNIIYCGMGEHAVRAVTTSYGDGMYKSTDAGKTWKSIGLQKTQHISRILIHPTNPDIVFVAAQGALYGPSKERGIYKSTDGGQSWKNVLFINDLTGSSELSMDMNNPDIIYAAMWHHQRTPWKVISGGEGSGLYKSIDGGESWTSINQGIPTERGKMAISVSRSNSEKVYALVESDSDKDLGGLFVSSNSGENWTRVSGDNRLTQRAWYYIKVFADPNNENTVYVLSAPALRSLDGGVNWEVMEDSYGDYHDLWINPKHSKNMIISDDGGAGISFNAGQTWSTQSNMPTSQFYRVNADNIFPYNLYGGQQDNTSLRIASIALGNSGITARDWTAAAGSESAFIAFDPNNPRYTVGGSYLGTIDITDMEAKAYTNIMAAPIQYLGREARNMKYLYNWNAPIIWSQYKSGTLYHAAQMVLKTSDMGLTWDEFSPDLTRNQDEKQGNGGGPYTNEAVGAENYGTISYMVESPHEQGVFWVGSDDGYVHLSKNDGKTWNNITPKGLNECLINALEVSPHEPGTAYIATTRYKFNDYTPAIYKTTNYGLSWTNISEGIPYGAFTRVVREDPARRDLLYAGTETGIYISWDGGTNWERFQLNLPITAITDLKVHQGDLLVATNGRSYWILDDLAVLAQFNKGKQEFKIYQPDPAVYGSWGSPLNDANPASGTNTFEGVNPANGVVLYYQLPEADDTTTISLIIKNSNGNIVRSLSSIKDESYKKYDGGPPMEPILSTNEGLNRVVWDMRHPIMPGVPNTYLEANYRGHQVSPGTYSVELRLNDKLVSTSPVIADNPISKISASQFEAYDAIMTEMEQTMIEIQHKINYLKRLQNQLSELLISLKKKQTYSNLVDMGETLLNELQAWDEDMVQRKSTAYDDVENFPNKFNAEYLFLINQTESPIPRVNQASKDRKAELDAKWRSLEARANSLIQTAIPNFNAELWKAGIGAIQLD